MNETAINIIPKPKHTEKLNSSLNLNSIDGIHLENNTRYEKFIGQLIKRFLKPIKELEIEHGKSNYPKKVNVSLNAKHKLKKEEYRLIIDDKGFIALEASHEPGLFYGFQSFRQLCDPELEKGIVPKNLSIPSCIITDSPTFRYRGMHLDVSRHFFDLDFIKLYIDMIALHKMNVFHWHLTDDNGWRIEIKKYPLLTEKSAWRVDRRHEPWKKQSSVKANEKATYGGFYTQEEIKEVLEYASERNILVIPEIEMPGHTSEVFAAYPELSCNKKYIPVQPGSYWPGVDIFCAGNDEVFSFLKNVLEEVALLFPGPYIHIGGDEADKLNWRKCNKCQKRINDEGLKDEHELQSWFIKEIEEFILSKDKKLVGWDEILEGGLAKSATVMSWRGFKGGIESAKAGHDVIMCPVSHCYFDYYQSDPESAPAAAFGGMTTLKTVYLFDPIPKELDEKSSKFILGAQGNLWTEYVQTPEIAQYRVLPRMSALSEVLWSGPGSNTYEEFYFRLNKLKRRFELLEWNYSPGSFKVKIRKPKSRNFSISLSSEHPGKEIYYTKNGDHLSQSSNVFKNDFSIKETTTIKAALLLPDGTFGPISEKTFYLHNAIGKKISYNTKHADKYPGSGEDNLINGLIGSVNHNDGYWQGWEREDMEIIIDLKESKKIESITCGFLESHNSWIFLPGTVQVSFSGDGKNFTNGSQQQMKDGKDYVSANRKEIVFKNSNQFARYILIKAVNRRTCPSWHTGNGGDAWVFADEIVVE